MDRPSWKMTVVAVACLLAAGCGGAGRDPSRIVVRK